MYIASPLKAMVGIAGVIWEQAVAQALQNGIVLSIGCCHHEYLGLQAAQHCLTNLPARTSTKIITITRHTNLRQIKLWMRGARIYHTTRRCTPQSSGAGVTISNATFITPS